MSTRFLDKFHKPLLDDLVAGRWLPIIGAGFSRNAIIATGGQLPLWDDLGRKLAEELPQYPYSVPLDAISAYAHEYGRPRLVERLGDLLHVHDARPGEAHRAFCSIAFDIVCTTNFDFLLESQYEASHHYCRPVIEEDHLSVNTREAGTLLLKFHGDLHHPGRLVATEEDYDSFLDKYPLLATFLANLLITRTAVLIGFSLDDPDFRQLWQVIGSRLGRARRPAHAIVVDAAPTEVTRFARRGVKVINLPGSQVKYGSILTEAFDSLREYQQANVIKASHVTDDEPLAELSMPIDSTTRLAFFAVPLSLVPFYKEQVFPIANQFGFVPVTATDVVSLGEVYAAKIQAMLARAACVVVDASTATTILEFRAAIGLHGSRPILAVVPEGMAIPSDLAQIRTLLRPAELYDAGDDLRKAFIDWFANVAANLQPTLEEEPRRLLKLREYRAAVIAAMTLLERRLREKVQTIQDLPGRGYGLTQLLRVTQKTSLLADDDVSHVIEWLRIRNSVVHGDVDVPRARATDVVVGVYRLVEKLRVP